MSVQRRRGRPVTIYPRKTTVDDRGNTLISADLDHPFVTRAAVIPQRSSKAEVPGQQQIDVVRLLISTGLGDIGIWGYVHYDGSMWDVVAPPAMHYGMRRTRHLSLDIRRRPDPHG